MNHRSWIHAVKSWTLSVMTVVAVAASARGARIEPDPGPGVDTYKSDRYRVEIWSGHKWIESYTYMTDNPNGSDEWDGGAIHFANFGTDGEVNLRVTGLNGPLKTISVSPQSKHFLVSTVEGRELLRLRPYDKVWLTQEPDEKSSSLLIFANPLKPAVPQGARYYKPGVQCAGDNGSPTCKVLNSQIIYLDAGAWVKGNFDVRHCAGARLMGPGVLSGEIWNVKDQNNPWMVWGTFKGTADLNGQRVPAINSYQDFTVVRAPAYNFGEVQSDFVDNIKLISPWRHSTDGFQIAPHGDKTTYVQNCFAFVGDDVFFPRQSFAGDLEIGNCFVASTNNSVFQICYWGYPMDHSYTMYAHDIDVKNYLNRNSAVFRASINGREDTGVKNMTFENINIQGNLKSRLFQIENREYFWPKQTTKPETKLGNTQHFIFRNVSLDGAQAQLSTLLGLDANNGHHDYLFENVSIDGTVLTDQNYSSFININQFTSNICFSSSANHRPVAISTQPR
jgi:hypothetical protein